MTHTDRRLLLLDERDNVLLATAALRRGEAVTVDGQEVTLAVDVALGHKLARRPIAAGSPVLKYGVSIGAATQAIAPGSHVHVHNLASNYTATHSREGGGQQ